MKDDLGHPVGLDSPAQRVVSLVPSLSESIAATRPDALVGVTDWCTHPTDLDLPRVRGTKNPDLKAIAALQPDVVLANKEENRELDVRRLREAGVTVWVTDIETLDGAFTSLHRMFDALGWKPPAWLGEAQRVWAAPATLAGRVAVPIWRDPWMIVGSHTFTGDVVTRLGLTHVFGDHADRYPHVDLADIDSTDLDLVLLPDEPYVFTADDGPEAFAQAPTALVSGRDLTWYGPSLIEARGRLADVISTSSITTP